MSLLSYSHTLGPIISEATPRCVKKGGSGQMRSLLGINCRHLVSPSDHFACSIVVPVAIPHEGLTSRGTVYSNCSSWVYRFSLVGPSLSWGQLGTMSLFGAASKMPCASLLSPWRHSLPPCASLLSCLLHNISVGAGNVCVGSNETVAEDTCLMTCAPEQAVLGKLPRDCSATTPALTCTFCSVWVTLSSSSRYPLMGSSGQRGGTHPILNPHSWEAVWEAVKCRVWTQILIPALPFTNRVKLGKKLPIPMSCLHL